MLDMSIIDCEGSRAIDWMMKLSYFVRPDHEVRHRVPGEHAGSEYEEILRVSPSNRSHDGNVPVGDAATIELVEQLATIEEERKTHSRLSWWLEYRSSGNEANMFLRWVKAATFGPRLPD